MVGVWEMTTMRHKETFGCDRDVCNLIYGDDFKMHWFLKTDPIVHLSVYILLYLNYTSNYSQ
jgi:hypothetical protein